MTALLCVQEGWVRRDDLREAGSAALEAMCASWELSRNRRLDWLSTKLGLPLELVAPSPSIPGVEERLTLVPEAERESAFSSRFRVLDVACVSAPEALRPFIPGEERVVRAVNALLALAGEGRR